MREVVEEIGDCIRVTVYNVVDNSIAIISLLQENPRMSAQKLAEKLSVTERTVQRNIKELQKTRKIKRVVPDKAGLWEIVS